MNPQTGTTPQQLKTRKDPNEELNPECRGVAYTTNRISPRFPFEFVTFFLFNVFFSRILFCFASRVDLLVRSTIYSAICGPRNIPATAVEDMSASAGCSFSAAALRRLLGFLAREFVISANIFCCDFDILRISSKVLLSVPLHLLTPVVLSFDFTFSHLIYVCVACDEVSCEPSAPAGDSGRRDPCAWWLLFFTRRFSFPALVTPGGENATR